MGHASHESDEASDEARDDVRWRPPSGPRSWRLAVPTIASSSSRRGRHKRRLRWRAARLWGAAAAFGQWRFPVVEEGSVISREGLSPGVRRALAQIHAADPLAAHQPAESPAGHANEADPLRRVAEERASYGADTEPREPDEQL